MPDKRILNALGMTAQQWGQLPPESESPQRRELKQKAMAIIAEREKAGAGTAAPGGAEAAGASAAASAPAPGPKLPGLEDRVAALEAGLRAANQRIDTGFGTELTPIANRVNALDSRVDVIEKMLE